MINLLFEIHIEKKKISETFLRKLGFWRLLFSLIGYFPFLSSFISISNQYIARLENGCQKYKFLHIFIMRKILSWMIA